MENSNSLGSFVWGVIVVFVALFTGIVWYAFEYWYIVFGFPIVIFVVFFIKNFKELRESYKIEIENIARREESK